MPSLTTVALDAYAFKYYDSATTNGSIPFISLSRLDIGALAQYFGYNECWSVRRVPASTTSVVIRNFDCTLAQFDFSRYPELRTLSVGDMSCSFVNELKLIGMSKLESVEIGATSFDTESGGQFYVKNCPKLKTLQIGRFSFSDYSVCEMSALPSLETIDMGEVGRESYNFYYASLELKRIRLCAVRYA